MTTPGSPSSRPRSKGHRDLVTVVGSLPSVSPGEWPTAQGRWIQDKEFGLQFRAEMLTSTPPNTREGIEKYLGSGMVKGIGPVYAKKLVEKFGEAIFDTIENSSALLEEVGGIGPKRRQRIKDAILAGGPMVGRIALRFIMEADSPQELDRIISGLSLWPLAETRVTPLIAFTDRRKHVQSLLENLAVQPSRKPTKQ